MGLLKRPCDDCRELFEPTGHACLYCNKCLDKRKGKRGMKGLKQ